MTRNFFTSLFLFCAALCQAQKFSLSDILSAPYATDLVASVDGNQLAWVSNDRGVRNIWIASGPEFQPRQLSNYTQDDGLGIGSLFFMPGHQQLIYVRGNGANRQGELANPASFASEVTRSILKIDLEGGDPVRLSDGSNPVLSPDGKLLLYGKSGSIWQLSLEGDSSAAKPLFSARGSNGNYSFSPSGQQVAFVSNRGDHSFIGVYELGAQRIRWIAPGVDRDNFPVWSPDGRQLAFIRTAGSKRGELRNIMSNNAFSVLVANVATGQATAIWTSPNDLAGGFAQYYPADPIRWTAGDRMVFYSEHDGWMRLYSVQPDGEELKVLTPGGCEAEHSALSPNGQTLYFTSNCDDMERRHLWRVPVGGGKPSIITSGSSIETDPVVLSDGKVAVRAATAKETMGIAMVEVGSKKIQRIFPVKLPEVYPLAQLVEPQTVIFKAVDGVEVHGQLFLPQNIPTGQKFPGVLFMHGGPIRQMLAGYHYSGYYANAYAMNQFLASRGYAVLAVNYRAGIGYGRDFRLAENQGPRGASEYQDIVAAAKYLQGRKEVDPQSIGLWGGSYGGLLTAMGLARNSDLFAAGVDLHGVHDWAWRGKDFSPGGGWGIDESLMDQAFRSSPVNDVDKWTSPVLFVHGDDDRNVMFGQTVDLVQRLRQRQVPMEILVFPDEVHGFLRHESWLRTFEASADFFDKYLKKSP